MKCPSEMIKIKMKDKGVTKERLAYLLSLEIEDLDFLVLESSYISKELLKDVCFYLDILFEEIENENI